MQELIEPELDIPENRFYKKEVNDNDNSEDYDIDVDNNADNEPDDEYILVDKVVVDPIDDASLIQKADEDKPDYFDWAKDANKRYNDKFKPGGAVNKSIFDVTLLNKNNIIGDIDAENDDDDEENVSGDDYDDDDDNDEDDANDDYDDNGDDDDNDDDVDDDDYDEPDDDRVVLHDEQLPVENVEVEEIPEIINQNTVRVIGDNEDDDDNIYEDEQDDRDDYDDEGNDADDEEENFVDGDEDEDDINDDDVVEEDLERDDDDDDDDNDDDDDDGDHSIDANDQDDYQSGDEQVIYDGDVDDDYEDINAIGTNPIGPIRTKQTKISSQTVDHPEVAIDYINPNDVEDTEEFDSGDDGDGSDYDKESDYSNESESDNNDGSDSYEVSDNEDGSDDDGSDDVYYRIPNDDDDNVILDRIDLENSNSKPKLNYKLVRYPDKKTTIDMIGANFKNSKLNKDNENGFSSYEKSLEQKFGDSFKEMEDTLGLENSNEKANFDFNLSVATIMVAISCILLMVFIIFRKKYYKFKEDMDFKSKYDRLAKIAEGKNRRASKELNTDNFTNSQANLLANIDIENRENDDTSSSKALIV